jgi:hypothetical protein
MQRNLGSNATESHDAALVLTLAAMQSSLMMQRLVLTLAGNTDAIKSHGSVDQTSIEAWPLHSWPPHRICVRVGVCVWVCERACVVCVHVCVFVCVCMCMCVYIYVCVHLDGHFIVR